MRTAALIVATCTVLHVAHLQAQADFRATALKTGDEVRVTRPSGLRLTGVVTAVSPLALTVGDITVAPEQGLRVERAGDSIWNGLAIGAVTGSVLGASIKRGGCADEMTFGCVAKPALVFGALGALIDYRHVGHTTVFLGTGSVSSRLIPILSREAKGLLVGLRF